MSKTDTEINVSKCLTCSHNGLLHTSLDVVRACCYHHMPLSDKPYEIDCEQDTCDGFGPIYYRPGTCRKYKSMKREADK